MDDSLLSLLNHRILGSLTPFTLEINVLSPNILLLFPVSRNLQRIIGNAKKKDVEMDTKVRL